MTLDTNLLFDETKKPYELLSTLYNEINKIESSNEYYNVEINDLKNNYFKDYFEDYLEIDPILELLTNTMSLDDYIETLQGLKSKADPNKTIIIKSSSHINDSYQRSTIVIPLNQPTKNDLKQRITELEHLISKSNEKKSFILNEIDKILLFLLNQNTKKDK
jgi:hypothetical protein